MATLSPKAPAQPLVESIPTPVPVRIRFPSSARAPVKAAAPAPAPISLPASEFFDGVEGIIDIERVPAPIAKPVPAPVTKPASEPTTIRSSKEDAEPPKPQAAAQAAQQTKSSSRIIPVLLLLFFLILAGGGAMYYFLSEQKDASAGMELPIKTVSPKAPGISDPNYIRIGWQADAYRTLGAFIEGSGVEAKLPHIRDAESLRPKMDLLYGDAAINDKDIPAKSFAVRELPPEIHKRGIFMLNYPAPPESTKPGTDKPPQVFALFKWTNEGLKLDWEIFTQTKYRTFRKFAEQPKIGARGTFRVLIAEDQPPKGQVGTETRTYLIKDPANLGDLARVNVKVKSPNGKELSAINWIGTKDGKPITRTATVELEWAGTPDKPVLSMRRFICWEFLGLGGTEIPATAIPE